MRLLPLWLHLLSGVVWLGGLLFQSHILIPLLAQGSAPGPLALAIRRFRRVAWTALALLVLTGFHNLTRLPPLSQLSQSGIVRLLAFKLFLVLVLLMLSVHRDFAIAARLLRELAGGKSGEQALKVMARFDRAALLLGVVLLYLGLAVSRGGLP